MIDYSDFLRRGKDKEVEFTKLFEEFFSRFATEDQDMKEHWDVEFVRRNGTTAKVDVKGLKKKNRNGLQDETIHWIEIKNVGGYDGWAYGQADFFAFEKINSWVIVSRESLQALIAEKTIKEYRNKKLYYLYQRQDRKDVITLVKTSDLEVVSTLIKQK